MSEYSNACLKAAKFWFIISGVLLIVFLLVNQPPKEIEKKQPFFVIYFKEIK